MRLALPSQSSLSILLQMIVVVVAAAAVRAVRGRGKLSTATLGSAD